MHHLSTTLTLVTLALATMLAACGGSAGSGGVGGAAEPSPTAPPGATPTAATRGPGTARPTRSTANLAGTAWVLTALGGRRPVKGAAITLRFEGRGSVSGRGGCNSYFGKYTARDDGAISVRGVGSTEMACNGRGVVTQESTYFQTLAKAATYRIKENRLELAGGAGDTILAFVREKPPIAAPVLAGTEWVLTTLRGRSPIRGSGITLVFTEEYINGSSGCNAYYADRYTLRDGTLKFGEDIVSTLIACEPKRITDQESAYLEAMGDAASYRVAGRRLEIRNAEGETTLAFTRSR